MVTNDRELLIATDLARYLTPTTQRCRLPYLPLHKHVTNLRSLHWDYYLITTTLRHGKSLQLSFCTPCEVNLHRFVRV